MANVAYAPAAPAPPPATGFDLPDAEAVHQVISGHREMFEVLVRRYNPRLYRVGMAYLSNHALAEDAMQNAYLKAFLALRRFRGTASFGTWLTRIMINECLMMLRRQKQLHMETLDADGRIERDAFAVPAPDTLAAQEIQSLIEKALQDLPRNHRAVYLLREVQHLSTAETAASLGLTEQNVKVCLHRAREGLKAGLLKSAAGIELFAYPARYCDPMTANVMAKVRAAGR